MSEGYGYQIEMKGTMKVPQGSPMKAGQNFRALSLSNINWGGVIPPIQVIPRFKLFFMLDFTFKGEASFINFKDNVKMQMKYQNMTTKYATKNQKKYLKRYGLGSDPPPEQKKFAKKLLFFLMASLTLWLKFNSI